MGGDSAQAQFDLRKTKADVMSILQTPLSILPSIFPDWLCTLRGQWLLFDSLPLTGLIHHQDETEKNGVPGDYEGF